MVKPNQKFSFIALYQMRLDRREYTLLKLIVVCNPSELLCSEIQIDMCVFDTVSFSARRPLGSRRHSTATRERAVSDSNPILFTRLLKKAHETVFEHLLFVFQYS